MAKEENTKITSAHVYSAITEVMKKISVRGIPKDLKIKFKERTIAGRSTEIIVQTLMPLLVESNLTLSFKTLNLVFEQNFWIATVEYTLTSSLDNSQIVSVATGAAAPGEKAIQNAMTYAYKNFFTQTFLITEGSNSEDEESHAEEKYDQKSSSHSVDNSLELQKRAINKVEELKVWLSENAENVNRQAEFGQRFYSSINHPMFPAELRTECLNYLTEYNIVNKVII